MSKFVITAIATLLLIGCAGDRKDITPSDLAVAAAEAVIGMLLAVDTGSYGPVDQLKFTGNGVCRVYEVQQHLVHLCNNGEIVVEKEDE